MEDLERPNPAELLGYIQKAGSEQKLLGKLKIYLGAAPGVGKTHTMLTTAIDKIKEGVDVVAGIIESHGRHEIEALAKQIENLPRSIVNYKDKSMTEFDLDAAIKRNPQLLLVDELAHSNVPDSRHNKRWQDIIELLNYGIDVYTTLNVQHVESLNSIVTQLVGIVVKETVPDVVLEKAYAIELIDLPPEELIDRLKDGKVYVGLDIGLAIDNFFRTDNLIALRELALKITAEQVEAKILLYRHGELIEKIWPIKERLLVCVSSSSNAGKLIRTTFRIAKRLKAEWIAINIELPDVKISKEESINVIHNLQLVEQLGGQSLTISSYNIAREISNFANANHITRIILGQRARSRWLSIFNPSVADELIRSGDAIDLHILRSDYQKNVSKIGNTSHPKQYFFDLTNNVYLAIIASSILFCWLISSLLFKYLGLNVSFVDVHYIIIFICILLTSQIIIYLTLRLRRQTNFVKIRERSMANMHFLNKQLIKTRGANKLLELAVKYISEIFDSKVLILFNELYPEEHLKSNLTSKEQSVAAWVYKSGIPAGLGTQTLPDNKAVYMPLIGSKGQQGVLRILPKDPNRLLIPEQMHLLEGVCNQIAIALEVDLLHAKSNRSN